MRLRGSEHLYDVNTGKYSAVSQHFNQQDHSIFDMAIIFIQRALRKKDRRLLQEAELVNLLGTITPKGMNKIMPLLRHTLTSKELAYRNNGNTLPMKMKPKMTWLKTVKKDTDKDNDNEPPVSTPPRRYLHQGRSVKSMNGEMFNTSTDTPEHAENTPPTKTNDGDMEKPSKYSNEFYMNEVVRTVDQKRRNKKTKP